MRRNIMLILGLIRLVKNCIFNLGKLKIHGLKYNIGFGTKIWIHSGGTCDLGKKTWISDFSSIEANGGEIKLGYNNFFNTGCKLISLNKIYIGDNNLFGPNVIIVDHKHNYNQKNKLICKQGFSSKPVYIGSNVWICSNVVITEGAKISDGIIVSANSVVYGNLCEKGVYSGNPAVLIKKY